MWRNIAAAVVAFVLVVQFQGAFAQDADDQSAEGSAMPAPVEQGQPPADSMGDALNSNPPAQPPPVKSVRKKDVARRHKGKKASGAKKSAAKVGKKGKGVKGNKKRQKHHSSTEI